MQYFASTSWHTDASPLSSTHGNLQQHEALAQRLTTFPIVQPTQKMVNYPQKMALIEKLSVPHFHCSRVVIRREPAICGARMGHNALSILWTGGKPSDWGGRLRGMGSGIDACREVFELA
ncbi:uncharacterized protein EI97DRAFT_272428 [Westerdykella ornata]|uniref:Uncharacterized protein n=1 Tax=Westerdykella ornata TaxID=318751 RepID=A0A6A6JNF1_WESOR|nr:uncharacterized protein EI97DRAFT_272428 [Westerdykella ornata]KAF2277755.1 hypothetical protein EI97DRAFT_272428 [Westerdykella ornata]